MAGHSDYVKFNIVKIDTVKNDIVENGVVLDGKVEQVMVGDLNERLRVSLRGKRSPTYEHQTVCPDAATPFPPSVRYICDLIPAAFVRVKVAEVVVRARHMASLE